jgi:hypothetical protein
LTTENRDNWTDVSFFPSKMCIWTPIMMTDCHFF